MQLVNGLEAMGRQRTEVVGRRHECERRNLTCRWTPALVEEYFADLKSVLKRAHSTMRAHQGALRHFTG